VCAAAKRVNIATLSCSGVVSFASWVHQQHKQQKKQENRKTQCPATQQKNITKSTENIPCLIFNFKKLVFFFTKTLLFEGGEFLLHSGKMCVHWLLYYHSLVHHKTTAV
jgi:hypothetical protein